MISNQTFDQNQLIDFYSSIQSRICLNKPQYINYNRAEWLYRITYNAALECERNFSKFRSEQIIRERAVPKRPSLLDQFKEITKVTHNNQSGPALEEAKEFAVTLMRSALEEAYIATTQTLKKWSKGERASLPKFRSYKDPQTLKFSAFTIVNSKNNKNNKRPNLKFKIKGIGTFKARLSRPLEPDHKIVELHMRLSSDRKMELTLVCKGHEQEKSYDPVQTGIRIHDAVRHLDENASNEDYYQAAVQAGIISRGMDVGVLAPITTSDNLISNPVRRKRSEVQAIKESQQDQAKLNQAVKTKNVTDDLVKKARRSRIKAVKAQRRIKNRRKTKAFQDAAMVVRGNGRNGGNPNLRKYISGVGNEAAMFIATEKRGLDKNIVEKNVRNRNIIENNIRDKNIVDSNVKDKKGWEFQKSFRFNRRTSESGMTARINRTGILCERIGAIHIEVDPRNTSKECSRCGTFVVKTLKDRTHSCTSCALVIDRDFNASINIVGRALKKFRSEIDPDGMFTKRKDIQAKILQKRIKAQEISRKGGVTRARLHAEKVEQCNQTILNAWWSLLLLSNFNLGCSDSLISE